MNLVKNVISLSDSGNITANKQVKPKPKTMKRTIIFLFAAIIGMALMLNSGCTGTETQTNSGVTKASVSVQTDANGNTVEQKQISKRLLNDNKPGTIKHLYVVSPYSGQTILYSTVDGKVTSSGKRLQPKTVNGNGFNNSGFDNYIVIGGKKFTTDEVIQDDGTFGDSDPYIFWFDVRGVYHQHFMTGGQIIHVSDQPLNVKSVIINIETLAENGK